MPIPQQFISTQDGQIADGAHRIRLSLNMDSSRHPVSGRNSSIYQLKEVSLLYEKEVLPEGLLNSSVDGSYNKLQKFYYKSHNQRHKLKSDEQGLVLASKFRGYAKEQSGAADIPHSKKSKKDVGSDVANFKTNQINRECLATESNLPLKQSPSLQNSLPVCTIEALLTRYRQLIMGKNQCRNSLDKRIDKYLRRKLETRYFAITEALINCEEKIKKLGYGKYIPRIKQNILENDILMASVSNSDLTPVDTASPIGQMIMGDIASKSSRLPNTLDEKPLEPKSTPFSMVTSSEDRDSIISKANKLCQSYQKLTRIKLRLREKLATDISNKELRKKIEDDYFKAQMKSENILIKLKCLAGNNEMDWRCLFDITNLDTDLDDSSGLLNKSAQSRSGSVLSHQNGFKPDSVVPYVAHVTSGSFSDDYNYSLSEYLQSSSTKQDLIVGNSSNLLAHDLDRLQYSSNTNSKNWYENRTKNIDKTLPVLKNKGVQTERFQIHDASTVHDSNKIENGNSYEGKYMKAPLDENCNFVDFPQVSSKVCLHERFCFNMLIWSSIQTLYTYISMIEFFPPDE